MLHFLEFYAIGWYWMSAYAIVAMLLQVFLMIALRSHYTMDMFAGLVFAHYFWTIFDKYSYFFDWCIFSVPLEKRMTKNLGLSDEEVQAEIDR